MNVIMFHLIFPIPTPLKSIKLFPTPLSHQTPSFYPPSLYSNLLLQPIMCLCFFFLSQLLAVFTLYPPLFSVLSLTPPLLFHAPLTLLLSPLGLLHLLVLAALVEVLHHHADEHVEDEEADNEKEGDEIQQHPWVVVGHRLGLTWCEKTEMRRMKKES